MERALINDESGKNQKKNAQVFWKTCGNASKNSKTFNIFWLDEILQICGRSRRTQKKPN